MGTPSGGLSLDSLPAAPTLSDKLRLEASKGRLDNIQALLRDGASFDIDRDGRTALHYAALNGYIDVTRFLIEKGCLVNIQDGSGYTALHRATSQGHLDIITLLVENGCDVNTQDEHGNAALHEAAWNGYSKTLELLVKHNVNIAITNKAGFSALHLAAQNGHNGSTRVLLYSGCNTDHKNNYGDTPLHTAARYGHAGVTRILISARAKLAEQNKNGDTTLHIAAALKRRKIAKLLVESGMDTSIRNKQNETALDVAKRKEHEEIVAIIQAFIKQNKPKRQRLKEVNFNDDIHEIDGPVVVPDRQLPGKSDSKPEKSKKFFFFKKKKSKEKEKAAQKGGVTQQKGVPTDPNLHIGKTPVQGLFSKYVPRLGVQYYRDLAGNVKQGPVGYSPTCHCGPAVQHLQKDVADTRHDVYGRIQSSSRAMKEHIAQVDHKSTVRVDALEQYTRQRFNEEEAMCQRRMSEKFERERCAPQKDAVRSQIQDWLEQKLEGYGHCLEHHHDDSALPSDNLFTNIHATANGRLFKSRSDETLSQSDNHSGHFRKKEFYESRQEAMQQIRAWQVPNYSRDRNKLKVSDQNRRPTNTGAQQRMQNMQNQKGQSVQLSSQHIPIEALVEIRNKNSAKTLDFRSPSTLPTHNSPYTQSSGDSNYMTMSGYQTQSAGTTYIPQSRSRQSGQYQSVTSTNSGNRNSGPVTHSTPKYKQSSPAESRMVHSHNDSAISQNVKPRPTARQQLLAGRDNDYEVMGNLGVPHNPPVSTRTNILTSTSQSSQNLDRSQTSGESLPFLPRPSSPGLVSSHPALPKPTFTTFGYDEGACNGPAAPANSPEQTCGDNSVYQTHSDILSSEVASCSTPRSNNETNSSSVSGKDDTDCVPKFPVYKSYGRQESQSSYGFVPTSKDDFSKSANRNIANPGVGLRQRTRSIEGLLKDNIDHSDLFDRSKSEDRSVELQTPGTPRSSSESRGSISTLSCSPNKWQRQTAYDSSPVRSYTQTTHPQAMSTPRIAHVARGDQSASTLSNPSSNPGARGVYNPSGELREVERGNTIQCKVTSNPRDISINNKLENTQCSDDTNCSREDPYNVINRCNKQEHPYSTVRDVKLQKDDNHNYPDDDGQNVYCFHEGPSNTIGAKCDGQAEPTRTSYQTYLTGSEHLPVKGNVYQRQSSPNICNVSKEDSSSNPDSGYSSKIYGNRAGSVPPPSNSGTPSSSFSTDRGISTPSNTNSPHSQYSNADYDIVPAARPEQVHEIETQVPPQSWYQRKLQETTQRIYDNWKSVNNSPSKQRGGSGQNVPPTSYSDGYNVGQQPHYTEQSSYPMSGQYSGQTQYGGYNYQHSAGNPANHLVSTFVNGSDV